MENANNDNTVGPTGRFFNKGGHKVDYVLVYETCQEREDKDPKFAAKMADFERKRDAFEAALSEQGLVIERESITSPQNDKVKRHFVKLHVPWRTLSSKAEELMLKAPLQENDIDLKTTGEKIFDPFRIKDSSIPEKPKCFMAYFKERKVDKYMGKAEPEKMFTALDRHYVVQRICYATRFAEGPKGVGLKQLVYEGAYCANYPLHDGDDDVIGESSYPSNDRQRLKKDWSSMKRIFKYQPLDTVKGYYGTAIALYFAWLGFYTAMLIPLAIVGLLVFIYGIGSSATSPTVRDACDTNNKFYMCPLCDRTCSYWDLVSTTCMYARVTHFFDNDGTVFLAIFTSVWATLFLEFWKRRQAVLAYEWHVANFEEEEEQIRPEFAATAPTLKKNIITGKLEPHIPRRTLYQRYGAIGSVVAFMILLVIAAVIGVVVYRAAVFAALSGNSDSTIRARYAMIAIGSRIITSMTAALINLLCINILKLFYNRLAVWLTNWENPRTKTDYEDSFTYKMYLFQFVNTYASIFYIAFFKSEIVVGTPGRYKRIAGKYRLEGCSAQGCFLELCVQMLIIMVGQQIIGNITEVAIPAIMTWIKERKEPKNKQLPQFEQDYNLQPQEEHNLFWEYLEIVLQYGFVTMFIAAFPLAPLFSLLNSIVEIRVDAINFVSQFRRPDTMIAEDIGAWYRILETLTRLSVLINAFVLSFTSEFIPKLVYKLKYAPEGSEGTLEGYLNNSLSAINVTVMEEWEPGTAPLNPTKNLNYTETFCRYKGYHDNTYPFKFNKQYWHVIAARLAFVFVFQYTVYAITSFIAWAVPDQPRSLELRSKREEHLTKKILYNKGRSGRLSRSNDVDSGHSGML
ncbi:predicted protein [Nematostella vectensis]|uniref:Anoctamin n=1 Tax=Nematostella vectensis TaxID=45351 RepID=A7RKU7_NEMVE|nr:predicted protein [Nematostella vectensis]|eukprot:XP_001640111.1 predicted protein [Nematostella vectensis]